MVVVLAAAPRRARRGERSDLDLCHRLILDGDAVGFQLQLLTTGETSERSCSETLTFKIATLHPQLPPRRTPTVAGPVHAPNPARGLTRLRTPTPGPGAPDN
ncbi:hypothetical protein GCM10010468_70700 [Actinocorallia longicatena]|uniref:Uncharacterized protein n=1 Tax=Actinocorallia longicatena TaxID=111803 RepID=A0ABP6QJT6_9ACTN